MLLSIDHQLQPCSQPRLLSWLLPIKEEFKPYAAFWVYHKPQEMIHLQKLLKHQIVEQITFMIYWYTASFFKDTDEWQQRPILGAWSRPCTWKSKSRTVYWFCAVWPCKISITLCVLKASNIMGVSFHEPTMHTVKCRKNNAQEWPSMMDCFCGWLFDF